MLSTLMRWSNRSVCNLNEYIVTHISQFTPCCMLLCYILYIYLTKKIQCRRVNTPTALMQFAIAIHILSTIRKSRTVLCIFGFGLSQNIPCFIYFGLNLNNNQTNPYSDHVYPECSQADQDQKRKIAHSRGKAGTTKIICPTERIVLSEIFKCVSSFFLLLPDVKYTMRFVACRWRLLSYRSINQLKLLFFYVWPHAGLVLMPSGSGQAIYDNF